MPKAGNLISVFARGNQELFHSSFLAWLMDADAPHGLGDAFLRGLLASLPFASAYPASASYDVITEHRDGRFRFDILLRPKNAANGRRGIVFENKVKSFGTHLQVDGYRAQGYDVVVLPLLRETLDEQTKGDYPVVEYRKVHEILSTLPLDERIGCHFVVAQYRSYLHDTLLVFDKLRAFAAGDLPLHAFRQGLAEPLQGRTLSDNDIRTFNYFYYYNFAEYLKRNAPDLIFGTLGYGETEDSKANTRWLYEKNMSGIPFMEALIYQPFAAGPGWRMHRCFEPSYRAKPFCIAPRLEVWLALDRLVEQANDTTEVGNLMLGTWSEEIKQTMRDREPYKSTLTSLANKRNFHRESVLLRDLPFGRLADRLRRMLPLIFDRTDDMPGTT